MTAPANVQDNFNKYAIPVKWGIIIGAVAIVLSSINYNLLTNTPIAFIVLDKSIFVITIFLYWATAAQQRKALGGYIDLRQAFGAIFIAILVSNVLSTAYNIIYTEFIDPAVIPRLREANIKAMREAGRSEEFITKTVAGMDKAEADSMKAGSILSMFATNLITSSVFGFVAAMIVKKKRPA